MRQVKNRVDADRQTSAERPPFRLTPGSPAHLHAGSDFLSVRRLETMPMTRRAIYLVVFFSAVMVTAARALPAKSPPTPSATQPQKSTEIQPTKQPQPRQETGEKPDEPDEKMAKLAATLRQLEKEISAVRGLEFKSPVVARMIPRPRGVHKRIRGKYEFKNKTLTVYDDVGANYTRSVLVHEMIHALQDQHFNFRRLHGRKLPDDASLALTALIEGDATLTMIELLKKSQPHIVKMLDAPLVRAKSRRRAFIYGAGARYVKALKKRDGWKGVNQKFKSPPSSTAEILHVKRVKRINLGAGVTRGELGILDQLAGHPKTAPLAVEAAAGWQGDSLVAKGPQKRWTVAFGTEKDAREFQAAMAVWYRARNPHLKSFQEKAGSNMWRGSKGNVVAVLGRGKRVLVLEAPSDAAYKKLLDQIEGLSLLFVRAVKQRRNITFGQLVDALSVADVVCVGELHTSEIHHRLQLQVIKALFARDERLGVGMEVFQEPFQDGIDRYVRNEIDEKEFLRQSEYAKRWSVDWALYRPIVEFCRRNAVPIAALNAPKELTDRVSRVGYDKLTEDEKKKLGEIDFQVKEHRDFWFPRLGMMHGKKARTQQQKAQAERAYQVMTVWDERMAANAARFQKDRGIRRMVVLAGRSHFDRYFGIPVRLAKRTGGKVVTVRIDSLATHGKSVVDKVADYIVVVR
jgi:uncharacterized iron-regulated protein